MKDLIPVHLDYARKGNWYYRFCKVKKQWVRDRKISPALLRMYRNPVPSNKLNLW